MTSRWLSMPEAMIYLRCRSRNTVLKYLREGLIDGKRLGGRWLIDRESIDRRLTPETRTRALELLQEMGL
jgi:hypothetical protein